MDEILRREQCTTTSQVAKLPFPFSMIYGVMKPGRIISIISTSANNNVSYREKYEEFAIFEHPIRLHNNEIKLLYHHQIPEWATDPQSYFGEVRKEIDFALKLLEQEQRNNWSAIVTSTIHCTLHFWFTQPPQYWDRKYSLVNKESANGTCSYTIAALFPFVEEVYRERFWMDFSTYVRTNEREILDQCSLEIATPESRERFFEQLVIARLVPKSILEGLGRADFKKIFADARMASEIDELLNDAVRGRYEIQKVHGHMYPERIHARSAKRYFIPMAPDFPAVDMIITVGTVVIAFQIHISEEQPNVIKTLVDNARAARWNTTVIQKIILVYLSPKAETAQALKESFGRYNRWMEKYTMLFDSVSDFRPLRDLQGKF